MTGARRFLGYVQAGGGSTRFGRDKALVELDGKSMLARTTELVGSVCDQVKIVAAGGKYGSAPAWVVEDGWPGEGPLGGILTALQDARDAEPAAGNSSRTQTGDRAHSWVLIVGCDMPFLTREWLGFLCERASRSSAQVVVPQSASGLEPLCACWNSKALPGLDAAFASGVRKVAEAMKQMRMEVLDEAVWKRFDSHNRLFWNMNTPQDYEEARRILVPDY